MDIDMQRLDALIRQMKSTREDAGNAVYDAGPNRAAASRMEQAFDALAIAFMEIRKLRVELDELRAAR